MARFRGYIQGNHSEITRLGHSSLRVKAASWSGAVKVHLTVRNDVDWAYVALTTHSGSGTDLVLYDGPASGEHAQRLVHWQDPNGPL